MTTGNNKLGRRSIRIVAGATTMLVLVFAMLHSGRVAIARIFVKYATTVADPAAADSAIGITPNDAEVHYARGAVSNYLRQPEAAVRELEIAVSLRPQDYSLWLDLGKTRDDLRDQAGALSCFNEAVRLAPYYAQPRWQRGNVLFRRGNYDEAFDDLRQAASSDPDLLPALIDLAWGASGKDAGLTEQIVQPQNNKARYDLALFFAKHGKPDEAVSQVRSAGVVSAENRRDLIRALLSGGAMAQAFDVWSNKSGDSPAGHGLIFDGGFESSLSLDESGFGWRVAPAQAGLSLSLDGSHPQSGSRSLRIDFSGHANPNTELISQLILVDPATRYKLNFGARTNKIVTGGPLVLVVSDAKSHQSLGRSARLPADTGGWQTFSCEFATAPATQAIVISLQREDCTTSPCPIFGSVNLDNFSLERPK